MCCCAGKAFIATWCSGRWIGWRNRRRRNLSAVPAPHPGSYPTPTGYAEGGSIRGAVNDDDNDIDNDGGEGSGGAGNGGDEGSEQPAFNEMQTLQRWGAMPDRNPVALGLHDIMHRLQLGRPSAGVQDSSTPVHPGVNALRNNDGAATDEEMQAMRNLPGIKGLEAGAQQMAIYDHAVSYWLGKGDLRKAAKVAGMLVMYGKQQSETLGAAAAAAVQKGDMKSAVSLLTRAYDNVPDGKTLQAQLDQNGNVHAMTTGPGGVQEDLGTIGPAQVYKLALGVRSGTDYMQRMAHIAAGNIGVSDDQNSPARTQLKPADFDQVASETTDAVDKLPGIKSLDDATVNALKNNAVPIAANSANRSSGLTSNEVAQSVAQIAVPDAKNPANAGFMVAPAKNGSGMGVQFKDGRVLFVPQPQFNQLMAIRVQMRKKMEQEQAEAKKPGLASRIVKDVQDAWNYQPTPAELASAQARNKELGDPQWKRDLVRPSWPATPVGQ